LDPKNNETHDYFLPEKESPELLMNIMNKLCFNKNSSSTQLDGNFISIYNEKDNRFHYYAHRLNGFFHKRTKINKDFIFPKGIEIEDVQNPLKGKMWVCYVNKIKQNWDLIVENDFKIIHKDVVLWKYEAQ